MRVPRLAACWVAALLFAMTAVAQDPITPESMCYTPPEPVQAKLRKEWGPAFAVVETTHFRVVSDCSRRYHQLVAGSLEQFYLDIRKRFLGRELPQTTVGLFREAADFDALMRKRGLADKVRGQPSIYSVTERVIYVRRVVPDGSSSVFATLFRDATRAMVQADFGFVPPLWFEEGFTALFEESHVLLGKVAFGSPNPVRDGPYRAPFESRKIPPLSKFLLLKDSEYRGPLESLNGNTGRSLCLWLSRKSEPMLAKFVSQVRDKRNGVFALESATHMKMPDIESEWKTHVATVHFGGEFLQRARAAAREDALRIYAEGAGQHRDYGVLRGEYARKLMAAKKGEEAEREAEESYKDKRCPRPDVALNVLLWRYGTTSKDDAVDAARRIVELQPWLESIEEPAHRVYCEYLESTGKADEAKKLRAELERIKAGSDQPASRPDSRPASRSN